MSIKERHKREKQEVRQGILSAARDIALHEGWQAVTIRKVAERIEYSPSMIYEYFASKEAILLELLCEGFRLLAVSLNTTRGSQENDQERLLAMADAYWAFAMRHPELYQVMHGLNGVPIECTEKPQVVQEAFATTVEALQDWSHNLGIELADVEGAVQILHAFLHGFVCLKMENRFPGDDANIRQLVQRGVCDLLMAWSKSTRG